MKTHKPMQAPLKPLTDVADGVHPDGPFGPGLPRVPRDAKEARELELSWLPEPSCRPDGFEALLFHRGKWRHMRWSEDHEAWSLGYGKGFVVDTSDRAYAPLPPKPEGADGFFDWKD